MNTAPNKFSEGQRVITNHGNAGVIAKVDIAQIGDRVFHNMSVYTIKLDGQDSPLTMDFIDAHHTSGGCLRAA